MVHGGNIQFNFAKLSSQEVKQRVFHVIRSLLDFGTHHGCAWQQWWPVMPRFGHLMGRPNRPVTPPLPAKSRNQVNHACGGRHILRETRRTKERIETEFFGNLKKIGRRWSDETATFLRPFRAHQNQLGSTNPPALP